MSLKNIVVQVDRSVVVVSEVMSKLIEQGYTEAPIVLNSAYNANLIYTSDGVIHWDNESTPSGWVGTNVKVSNL